LNASTLSSSARRARRKTSIIPNDFLRG
jgi:hypothetical protein